LFDEDFDKKLKVTGTRF